jgi:predicted carbohydrate-binding protein with CBM5 and CBM33 domain
MRIRVLTAVFGGVVVALAMTPVPAVAHGAPDSPVSRTFACAPDGPHVRSDACQAALAASDRQSFEDWDYVRVAGVDGRDREVIPDGALCSGGVPGFAGLDLARADWPSTEVRAGAEFTFTYRTTIPHPGEFRLYVTRDGYDPAEPLSWSDLEDEPFLAVTDPELVGDAYQLPGRWPAGKTGHHVLFTVWQNFEPPDTYYACSDVVFDPPAGSPPSSSAAPTTAAPTPTAEPVGLARSVRPEADSAAVPIAVAAGAAVVVVAAVALVWRQRRLRRIR